MTEYITEAVAIAELLEHDADLVTHVEGVLLVAGSGGEPITPVGVAQETGLGREAAANLFRQLDTAGAADRTAYTSHVAESPYRIRPSTARDVLKTTRNAINAIDAYQQRQPPSTEADPLVTFPDDPAFADVTPADFGMDQLLSRLASEVKMADDTIVLVAPFFEGTGLGRLRGVLADALERGVDLTIITRYLSDSTSHNREVISDFIEHLRTERDIGGRISAVDYTVWNDDVPVSERTQDGEKPAFTLHAKVMAFDDTAAYVGSANMTDYGFDRYLELGVLLRGPPAADYVELCEFLLQSDAATEISL